MASQDHDSSEVGMELVHVASQEGRGQSRSGCMGRGGCSEYATHALGEVQDECTGMPYMG